MQKNLNSFGREKMAWIPMGFPIQKVGGMKMVFLGSIPPPITFALYHSMYRDYKVRSRLEFLGVNL